MSVEMFAFMALGIVVVTLSLSNKNMGDWIETLERRIAALEKKVKAL